MHINNTCYKYGGCASILDPPYYECWILIKRTLYWFYMHKYIMFLIWWPFLNLKPTLFYIHRCALIASCSLNYFLFLYTLVCLTYPARLLESNEWCKILPFSILKLQINQVWRSDIWWYGLYQCKYWYFYP